MKRGTYQPTQLLSIDAVAEMLGVHRRTLGRIRASADNPFDERLVRGSVRITIESVLLYMGDTKSYGTRKQRDARNPKLRAAAKKTDKDHENASRAR